MGWNEIVNNLLGDSTKPHRDDKEVRAALDKTSKAYDGMEAPTLSRVHGQTLTPQQAQAQTQGSTAFNGIQTDPANLEAQRNQLAALSNLSKNGGRSAASDANLAQIQQAENANAAGQRGAIMQNAQARGMGGSGNALLAQLSSSQNATNNQSAQDMAVRGQDQTAALNAGMGAAQIGANMHSQQYGEQAQKASAADAISRFNAGNQSQNSQFNAGQGNAMGEANANRDMHGQQFNSGLGQEEFSDRMGIAHGRQAGGKMQQDYWTNKYKEDQVSNASKTAGMLKVGGKVVGGVVGAVYGGPAGAAVGSAAGGAVGSAAGDAVDSGKDESGDEEEELTAAHGGRVPGYAEVRGDSLRNDSVPVNTSPGEVIIPRSLAHSGSPHEIASFVKNPPAIKDERSLRMDALKNLRSRR